MGKIFYISGLNLNVIAKRNLRRNKTGNAADPEAPARELPP